MAIVYFVVVGGELMKESVVRRAVVTAHLILVTST